MKTYAIDRAVKGTANFLFTGVTTKANRQRAAIKQAERIYPDYVVRVRLVSPAAVASSYLNQRFLNRV